MNPLHHSKAALTPSLTMSVHPSVLMPCYSCVISADTERAVEILTRYQSTLRSPEEQELKASIGKVSHIFQSELFQALLGKPLPCGPWGFVVSGLSWGPNPAGEQGLGRRYWGLGLQLLGVGDVNRIPQLGDCEQGIKPSSSGYARAIQHPLKGAAML